MSNTPMRIPLAEANALVDELRALLGASCARFEVAGSVRRRVPEVGDVEVLAIPKLEPELNLFGEPTGRTINLLDLQAAGLLDRGIFAPRLDKHGRAAVRGERYKRLTFRGVGLDLFAVLEPAQWGILFLIRTGPADYSHRFVTSQRFGGWLPAGLVVTGGAIRRGGEGGPVLPTSEEADVYAILGRPWEPPEERR